MFKKILNAMHDLQSDREPDFKELTYARAKQIDTETRRILRHISQNTDTKEDDAKTHKAIAAYYKSVKADLDAIKRYLTNVQQTKLEL